MSADPKNLVKVEFRTGYYFGRGGTEDAQREDVVANDQWVGSMPSQDHSSESSFIIIRMFLKPE